MPERTPVCHLPELLAREVTAQELVLPPMPATATQVLALLQQESTDAARIAQVLQRDQALAANVLRHANSAAFAGQVPCASLQQATSRLGMQRIAEIALAVAVRTAVFGSREHAELFAQLWRHALLTAFFSKEIARLRRRNVETAFLCGLLHDVGQAVLLANLERLLPGQRIERDELGQLLHDHHAAAGVLLAEHWRLPEAIVAAIRHHHDGGPQSRHAELAQTVCLADLLAHAIEAEGRATAPCGDPLRRHPVLLELNLYPDQLDALFGLRESAWTLVEGLQ